MEGGEEGGGEVLARAPPRIYALINPLPPSNDQPSQWRRDNAIYRSV